MSGGSRTRPKGTRTRPRSARTRPGTRMGRRGLLWRWVITVLIATLVLVVLWPHHGATRKLLWPPPSMISATTIVLRSGLDPDQLRLDPDRDYVLTMPPGGIHGTLEIDGGHDVTLIGGSITVPSTANQTDNGADDTDTAIYVRHSTGTVHIEGVLITAERDVEYDGIDINAPQATVQVENVRVQGVYGSRTTEHADVIQPWGGVRALEVDRLTADGDYQGLTIRPNLGNIGRADIHDVDLTIDPRPAALAARTVGGGIMLWLTPLHGCQSAATTLRNVYIDNASRRLADSGTVWPSPASDVPCGGVRHGDRMSWPKLPVTGSVTFGRPPGGAFVPAGVAGDGYRSPGYVGVTGTTSPR